MLVLDGGAVTKLAARTARAAADIVSLRQRGMWPPVVPSIVLVECLTGSSTRDANTNRLLKSCDVATVLTESLARRAGVLRVRARRGSAVDAVLVAVAEPGGLVLTGDHDDLSALAAHARDVSIERL